jgi:hypothetical protein
MSQPPERRRPGAWSTLVAVAAAIAVVATLAGVFHALSRTRVAAPAATPTPNFAAHITHARGHWTDVIQYKLGPNSSIYISPSDARIAFRAESSPADPTAVKLARTTDGGATWTTLTLPTDDGGWFGGIAFSPLDSQTVFLQLDSDQNNPHCPVYALGYGVAPKPATAPVLQYADQRLELLYPNSGGYSCTFQYVSRDGGAHWSHPTFPWQAQHFADMGQIGASSFPGQVQGTTLFAAVAGNLNGEAFSGVRLVASEDGGSTWSAADTAIYAAGQIVTGYTAVPGTTSLYAISVPQQTPIGQDSNMALWSSENAGAHWTRVGPEPLAQAQLVGTTHTPGGLTLYAVGIQSDGPVVVSRDGGRTWVQVSTAGWPQGQMTNSWSLNTLADGSLLMEFIGLPSASEMPADYTNVSFYAWRPGDTEWFPVTPRPSGGSVFQTWIAPSTNGPQSVWIIVSSQQDRTHTVRQCVLQ